MKRLKYLVYGLVLLLLPTACNDNEEAADVTCNGLPVVRDVKHTVLDSTTIVSGNLGEWIVVEGTNFCDITEICFNDVWVSMDNVYIEPSRISVSIPRVAPFEVSNTITFVTSKGDTVKHPFELFVPDLILKGMLNEWVKPGETGYIEGENFDIHQIDSIDGAWIMFGEQQLAVHRMNASRLWFEVPRDAEPCTPIFLFRQDSLGNMRIENLQMPGLYMDNRNILYDGTDNGTDPGTMHTDGLGLTGFPEAINGHYYYYQGDYAAWTWGGKWRTYTPFNIGQPMSNNGSYVGDWFWDIPTSECDIVFEVNVMNDWMGAAFKFSFWNGWEYHWMPWGSSAYRTNGWQTIRIPVKDFCNPVGSENHFPDTWWEATGNPYWDWKNREVQFHGNACPNVFFCWDNLRFVPRYVY
ncbi:MAG: hypothetical protein LBR67_01640 [Dysgonamonadaceae bacterium]|jgi:hypothetical protein|nr:hypothetical protein [Dysgonamonadaceae bacterium]